MNLSAGAATREITPAGQVALYGYPHVERLANGMHDPLLASVLVLRNAGRTVVLAALDLLMLEPPVARSLRRAVAEAAGCDESGVLISCTHTHSGPVTSRLIGWGNDSTIPAPDPDYLNHVRAQLAAAARDAAASAVPAELAWTQADATGVGGNRLADGGVTDPGCGVLAVRQAGGGDPLALALIYGMHPTVLHEDSTLVSADFPYYTRRHLVEQLGRDIPVLYHTAPCGNQSPRRFVQGQTFDEAERLGRKLGSAVWEALVALPRQGWQRDATLDGRMTAVDLPRNPIRPHAEAEQLLADYRERYARLQREGAPRAEVRTAECAVFGAEGTLGLAQAEADGQLAQRLRDYMPADVQGLRIGDTAVIGLPGECFTEYGLAIKRQTPYPAFAVSLVNGDLQGYIVTPEAAQSGGYEATNAVFAPESGAVLVEAALSLVVKERRERKEVESGHGRKGTQRTQRGAELGIAAKERIEVESGHGRKGTQGTQRG